MPIGRLFKRMRDAAQHRLTEASSCELDAVREPVWREHGRQADRWHAGYKEGDPDAVAAYYRIHFKAALKRPEHYEQLMARMRPSFTTKEVILNARHIEDRLMADTWSADGYDLVPKLRILSIPALVIFGDHDFIPGFVAAHIADSMPNARFVTMKDCGHFAYLECPGAARKEIDGFFRNVRARSSAELTRPREQAVDGLRPTP